MHSKLGFVGQLDVRAERIVAVERVADDGPAGERAKRGRADELAGRARHHHGNAVAVLHQRADERGRLVGRDAAGDADDEFVRHDEQVSRRSLESVRVAQFDPDSRLTCSRLHAIYRRAKSNSGGPADIGPDSPTVFNSFDMSR